MIILQGSKLNIMRNTKRHQLQDQDASVNTNHLQGAKHQLQHMRRQHLEQDASVNLHHLQRVKNYLLQGIRRPNVIFDKRRQAPRIFNDKHPLMIIDNIKRIKDIAKDVIFASRKRKPRNSSTISTMEGSNLQTSKRRRNVRSVTNEENL